MYNINDYIISKNNVKKKLLDSRLDIVYLVFDLYLKNIEPSNLEELNLSNIYETVKKLCVYLNDLNYTTFSGRDRYLSKNTINKYLRNWLIINYYNIGYVYSFCVLEDTDGDRLDLIHLMEVFTFNYVTLICKHINEFKCFNVNIMYKKTIEFIKKYRGEENTECLNLYKIEL